jgi:arylsulfatase
LHGLIGLSIGLAGCSGCSRDFEPGRNLLLITIDTLRADSLGAYGSEASVSPHIDRLAERSTVFERAYSTAPFTAPSHASILTSQHPSTTGVIYNGHRASVSIDARSITLAEHLSEAGFTTAAVVSAGPLDEKYGFARGFQEFTRIKDMRNRDIGGAGSLVDAAAEEWLLRRHGKERNERFFLWPHYFDPHLPYAIPKELREELWFAPDTIVRRKNAEQLPKPVVKQGYRAEVFEVDQHIGAILGLLDDLGLSRNTVVALTADHGEYLLEHGLIDHSRLYDEVLHVPMMIHWPARGAAERHPRPVSTIDLVPTLLAILGVESLPTAQGRNLLASSGSDEDFPVFAEWRDFRMLSKKKKARPGDFLVSV